MGISSVGDVVIVPFPYADLSRVKKRPALVLAIAEFNNVVVCQITSRPYTSRQTLKLTAADFTEGKLPHDSYIRVDKLSTLEHYLVQSEVGTVKPAVVQKVLRHVRKVFTTS
jgi:mRNA interferase MazF